MEFTLEPEWVEPLRTRLQELGIGYAPVFAVVHFAGDDLLGAVAELDDVELGTLPVQWELRHDVEDDGEGLWTSPIWDGRVQAYGFFGAIPFEVGGQRFAAARFERDGFGRQSVLAGPNLEALMKLVEQIDGIASRGVSRGVVVYGTERGSATLKRLDPVEEERVILAPELKQDLLGYIDGFLRSSRSNGDGSVQNAASGTDGSRSRGILLLGRPGTGKTHAIRHILHRMPEVRRYLFVVARPGQSDLSARNFEELVRDLTFATRAAVVVVEDIDRLFQAGVVTPQYFLNVLDGLLEPKAPILWIATSNDPTEVEDNLLDRPGRFNRVFVFPLPEVAERAALLRCYADGRLPAQVADAMAAAAAGLTGAHVKEVCYGAGLRALAEGVPYPKALERELDRMLQQHRDSRHYGAALRPAEGVGFQRAGCASYRYPPSIRS